MMIRMDYIWLGLITVGIILFNLIIRPHVQVFYLSDIPFGLLFGIILIWFRRYILSIFVVIIFGLWNITSFGQSPVMLGLFLAELVIANRIIAPDISDKSMVPLILYTIFCIVLNNIAEMILAVNAGSSFSTVLTLMPILIPIQISYSVITSIFLYLLVNKIVVGKR